MEAEMTGRINWKKNLLSDSELDDVNLIQE